MKPCSLVDGHRYFGNRMTPWNIGLHLQNYTPSQSRKQQSEDNYLIIFSSAITVSLFRFMMLEISQYYVLLYLHEVNAGQVETFWLLIVLLYGVMKGGGICISCQQSKSYLSLSLYGSCSLVNLPDNLYSYILSLVMVKY